jgi:hypothetical protein
MAGMGRYALRGINKMAMLSLRRSFTFFVFERPALCEQRAKTNFFFLGWTPYLCCEITLKQ